MKVLSALLVFTMSVSPLVAAAEEATLDTKGRKVFRDERPDPSRGWTIVAKRAYWSLCYESLDRLEEARGLIGKGNDKQLADVLEKCGAWLEVAGSAAQLDDESEILQLGHNVSFVADELRAGTITLSDSDLQQLITRGEILVARSHLIRSNQAFREVKVKFGGETKRENRSPELVEADKEIRRLNVERAFDENLYDANQSLRHRAVAKTYMETAAKAGGFEVPESFTNEIDGLTGNENRTAQGDVRQTVDEQNKKALAYIKQLLAQFNVDVPSDE